VPGTSAYGDICETRPGVRQSSSVRPASQMISAPDHRLPNTRRSIVRFGAGMAVIVSLLFMGAAGSARAASCPWMNRSLSADTRATMLLRAMSLTQKVAMTYQRYSIFFHDGTAGWIPAVPTLCIPDLTFNDAGQGVGDQQTGTTAFPAPIAQSSSWDPNLQYEFGRALGQEARRNWRRQSRPIACR
jgi:hypothetical protein